LHFHKSLDGPHTLMLKKPAWGRPVFSLKVHLSQLTNVYQDLLWSETRTKVGCCQIGDWSWISTRNIETPVEKKRSSNDGYIIWGDPSHGPMFESILASHVKRGVNCVTQCTPCSRFWNWDCIYWYNPTEHSRFGGACFVPTILLPCLSLALEIFFKKINWVCLRWRKSRNRKKGYNHTTQAQELMQATENVDVPRNH